MSDVEIKIAHANDVRLISDFIKTHFLPFEPLQTFHVRKEETMEPLPPDLLKDCIASETTLLAYVGEVLVGVLIAGEISAEITDMVDGEQSFGLKADEIFEFLTYIEKKANYCNRLNVPRSLHIHIINIHVDYLRRGLAKKLFNFCVEHGKKKDYPSLSVDCTSIFTSKIAESFEMTCLSTVTYEEYNAFIGKTLFIPSEPHTAVKSYAKLYDEKLN